MNDTIAPLSPCVGICTMDEGGLCLGCGRNLDEIASWGSLSDSERASVMAVLPERLQALVGLANQDL